MVNKKQILKESVKKLISLKIPDKEIITNLKDVGVEESEAREIIEDVKGQTEKAKAKEPYEEALEAAEEMASSRDAGVGKAVVAVDGTPSGDIAKLWEKGVLATVDSKLDEMQRIKEEVDSIIDSRIRAQLEKEIKKIEVLFDSQRTLLVSKVDAALEQKQEEVASVIDSRMVEIKKIGELTDGSLKRLDAQNKFSSEMVKTMTEKITELDNTKSRMISDLNSSLIENSSKVEELIKVSETKRDEIDARINRALELESKITEGLLKDAQAKIDKMSLAKSDELTERIKEKLGDLEAIEKRIEPGAIDRKLKEMDEARADLLRASASEVIKLKSGYAVQLNLLKKQFEKQRGEIIKSQKATWDRTIKAKAKEIDALKKEIDLEGMKATMESLELFKQQFIHVVEKNVADFNKAKRQVSATLNQRDNAIDEHIKAIDAKIAELDTFERNFAEEMGLAIDKLVVEKPKHKNKKKTASKDT